MKKFKSFDEVINDLMALKPLDKDLTHEQDLKDVMPLVKRVMTTIIKSTDVRMKEDEYHTYSYLLKRLGLTTFNDANKCFKPTENSKMGDILEKKGSIEFPLSAFTQLIDNNYDSASFGFSMMTDGDEYSWIASWFKAQGIEFEKIDNFVDEYNKENNIEPAKTPNKEPELIDDGLIY